MARTQVYKEDELMFDLLNFAAKHLVLGEDAQQLLHPSREACLITNNPASPFSLPVVLSS